LPQLGYLLTDTNLKIGGGIILTILFILLMHWGFKPRPFTGVAENPYSTSTLDINKWGFYSETNLSSVPSGSNYRNLEVKRYQVKTGTTDDTSKTPTITPNCDMVLKGEGALAEKVEVCGPDTVTYPQKDVYEWRYDVTGDKLRWHKTILKEKSEWEVVPNIPSGQEYLNQNRGWEPLYEKGHANTSCYIDIPQAELYRSPIGCNIFRRLTGPAELTGTYSHFGGINTNGLTIKEY
jgi:hypothetical protein